MFPTGVGMNRSRWRRATVAQYVPHRRGDEPVKSLLQFGAP